MRVLSTCFEALRPGGCVYQFTYHWRSPIERAVQHRLALAAHSMGRARAICRQRLCTGLPGRENWLGVYRIHSTGFAVRRRTRADARNRQT